MGGGNVGYSWGRSRNDIAFFNTATGAAIAPPAGAVTQSDFNLNGGVANGTVLGAASSSSTAHAGWTIGAGLEALFARDWSAKLEYLYIDLGAFDNSIGLATTPPIGATVHSRVTDNVFRFGINYHFNAGPVIARY